MALMLGLMDRFGPEAKQRQQLAEREMMLREGTFGLDKTAREAQNNLSAAQLDALRQQMGFAQTADERAGALHQFQTEQMNPMLLAQLAAGIGNTQVQTGIAQQQNKLAVNADQRAAQMQPYLLDRMRADIRHSDVADKRDIAQSEAARMAAMAGFVQNAGMALPQMPNMQIDPRIVSQMGLVEKAKPDPLGFLGTMGQLLDTDPQAALQYYNEATAQDQSNLPITPEQRISLTTGVTPEDLRRLFQRARNAGKPVTSADQFASMVNMNMN